MGQNFPKLLGSKYLCHLLSHRFIYQELKIVQEAFVWNNKILVNPFWHKIEAKAVSQKLQVLLLRHLLFSPFRSVYLLPATAPLPTHPPPPTPRPKKEQWSKLQPWILKEIVLVIRLPSFYKFCPTDYKCLKLCTFPLQFPHYYCVLVLSIYLIPIKDLV